MKYFRYLVTGCLIVLAGVSAGNAQQQILPVSSDGLSARGVVVDKAGKPMPGVPVIVQGPQGSSYVFTDIQGQWSLYNLPAGKYQAAPITAPNKIEKFEVEQKAWWSLRKNNAIAKVPALKM